MKIEKRAQFGELNADDSGKLTGYAAVFNKRSNDLGGFVEVIQPGAFKEILSNTPDVRALWNHDSNIVLGRTLSGTLELFEDDVGLKISITPPESGFVRDYLDMVKRGDVSQMSFAFTVRPDGQSFEELEDGTVVRTLKNLNLFEVSPVAFPAYPDTSVAVRAMQEVKTVNHAATRAKMLLGLHDRGLFKP